MERDLSHDLPLLATSGNRIVEARSGRPVLLRGINRSGLEYGPADPDFDPADFERIVCEWGANIVRLPFNQEWALGYERYRSVLDSVIEACASRSAYTLLDLQWLDSRTPRGYDSSGRANFVPPLPDAASLDLWRELAQRYGGEPAVLFDVFNEPHDPLPGDPVRLEPPRVTMREWAPWAAALVDAVRTVAPDKLIFVSGVNWGYDLRGFPLPGVPGLVYSTHVYPGKQPDWDTAFGDLSVTHPVFAAEWGGGDDNMEFGAELAAYLDARGIGWTAWGWPDNPPLIAGGGEPTAFGALVRGLLRPEA